MCGICGIIDYNAGSPVDEGLIKKMCAKLQHRGPDDEGVFLAKGSPSAALGHRRLSIIDLSCGGRQPMANEDGTVWITFNGEIYNYLEIRAGLEEKGHIFKSHTDTETVVHLYEEYGKDLLKYIRGMFAFAIWDTKKQLLFMARDRAGKKPLLYYFSHNRFCFSSEFASLLNSGFVEKKINKAALHDYLTFGYIPAPFSIYEGVLKLLPGQALMLKDSRIDTWAYWQLDYAKKIRINEQEAAEEILRLLRESVKIRMRSDVALGAFLSGGIDSSSVVGLMSRLSEKKVKTFSIGFYEQDFNELKYARLVAKRFGTEHNEFIVKPRALEVLPLLVERYGEPYADSSAIPTYYVSRETRKHVTVALNGDGGDELFAGYERYRAMLTAERINRLGPLARGAVYGLKNIIPDSPNAKNYLRRVKRFLDAAAMPCGQRYIRWVSFIEDRLKQHIYSDDFARQAAGYAPERIIAPFLGGENGLNMLDALLLTDVSTYLPNDLLVKVDIASMSNSLECRSPFLDHKLMEFSAQLPAHYKLRGQVKKYILKRAVVDLVPRKNIRRSKMGFGVPVGEWFRGELKGLLQETLLSHTALRRGYFKPESVKNIIQMHIERKNDYTQALWTLLMLELWHKQFMD